MLASSSDYFRARLEEDWSEEADRTVHIQVESSREVDALERVIEHVYKRDLEAELAGGDPEEDRDVQLIYMAKVGNQFQFPAVTKECLDMINDKPAETLSWATVTTLFDLPDFLHTLPEFDRAVAHAGKRLYLELGDLEAAWQSARKRQVFVNLPFQAVRALLSRSDLKVVSDNVVAVAALNWIEHQQLNGKDPWTSEVLGLVRINNLSHTFIVGIVPQIEALHSQHTLQQWMLSASSGDTADKRSRVTEAVRDFTVDGRSTTNFIFNGFVWDVHLRDGRLVYEGLTVCVGDAVYSPQAEHNYDEFVICVVDNATDKFVTSHEPELELDEVGTAAVRLSLVRFSWRVVVRGTAPALMRGWRDPYGSEVLQRARRVEREDALFARIQAQEREGDDPHLQAARAAYRQALGVAYGQAMGGGGVVAYKNPREVALRAHQASIIARYNGSRQIRRLT